MNVNLTRDEIETIATAISVAQQEDRLPQTMGSEEMRALLDKLGIRYNEHGYLIFD